MSRVVKVEFQCDFAPPEVAVVTRTIAVDGVIYEADMSQRVSDLFDQELSGLKRHGRVVEHLHPAISLAEDEPLVNPAEYNTTMRAWADEQGRGMDAKDGYHRMPKGGYYHSTRLQKDYAAYLKEILERRADG